MEYMFYTLFLFFVVLTWAALFYREHWISAARRLGLLGPKVYEQTSFREDVEEGLHSSNFNLTQNIVGNDGREGLEAQARGRILEIMKSKTISFDDARYQYTIEQMKKQGIDPSGVPIDNRLATL